MARIPPFQSQHLEAVCKVLADTRRGLTGAQIGRVLQEIKVQDVTPEMTKWKRLFNALATIQNQHHVGNHLILFINRAMDPVAYAQDKATFDWRKNELNVVLAFSGYYVRDDGKVGHTSKETTLAGARARACRLQSTLQDRGAHSELFRYCKAELLEDNCFHAVLEATKGVAQRIRDLSELSTDGAELVNAAFSLKEPCLALNSLQTET